MQAPHALCFLIGNGLYSDQPVSKGNISKEASKADLALEQNSEMKRGERIPDDEIQQFLQDNRHRIIDYFETNAITGYNVEHAFQMAFDTVVKCKDMMEKAQQINVTTRTSSTQSSSGCLLQ